MKKQEFMASLEEVLKRHHIKADIEWCGDINFVPRSDLPKPDLSLGITPLRDGYGKARLEFILYVIEKNSDLWQEWKAEQTKYTRTAEYRERRHKENFRQLALQAGLEHDEHGGYLSRGDESKLYVEDFVFRAADLRRYHASGPYLGLVTQARTRFYNRRYSPSTLTQKYLIGINENGTPFCHAVSANCENLHDAIAWIWETQVHRVIARHGDVAVLKSNLRNATGERGELIVIDSHVFSGEYRQNGALYVRNGVLRHTKDQHPDIHIEDEWRRLKVARRAQRGQSSRD
jgi:hypothetical protein